MLSLNANEGKPLSVGIGIGGVRVSVGGSVRGGSGGGGSGIFGKC
jgi:hypothetical protein